MHRALLLVTSLGGIGTALLSSLCYMGPLIFEAFGFGAGLGSGFEPLRPLSGAVMFVLLSSGFYIVYDQNAALGAADDGRAPGETCAAPWNRRHSNVILWTATAVALALWFFPIWSS